MATGPSQITRDEAAILSETFPLYDLPQELRDKIYEYSFDSKIIFRHTPLGGKEYGYEPPILDFHPDDKKEHTEKSGRSSGADKQIDVPEELAQDFWNDPNLKIGQTYKCRATDTLQLKIMIATPLLAVSRTMGLEVKRVIDITKRTWTRIFREATHLHRVRSPSLTFIDLWSRSELILDYNLIDNNSRISTSLFFLQSLPDSLKRSLQRLFFTFDVTLYGEVAWAANNAHDGSFFSNYLRNHFPNLHTIGIEIDNCLDDDSLPLPSDYFLEMLWTGRLDTVYLFSGEDWSDWNHVFLRHVTIDWRKPRKRRSYTNAYSNENAEAEEYRIGRRRRGRRGDTGEGNGDGDYDLILRGVKLPLHMTERSPIWREWGYLYGCYVVKITRELVPVKQDIVVVEEQKHADT